MAKDIEQKSEEPEKPKPFLTSPTAEQLRPDPEQSAFLLLLWDASEITAKSQRELGVNYQVPYI